MNFTPENTEKILAGRKTQTRRPANDNPRSPWYIARCGLQPGRDYAVCPGRRAAGVCRVLILSTSLVDLGSITDDAARAEGYEDREGFECAWRDIHGGWDPGLRVWRIRFCVSSSTQDRTAA